MLKIKHIAFLSSLLSFYFSDACFHKHEMEEKVSLEKKFEALYHQYRKIDESEGEKEEVWNIKLKEFNSLKEQLKELIDQYDPYDPKKLLTYKLDYIDLIGNYTPGNKKIDSLKEAAKIWSQIVFDQPNFSTAADFDYFTRRIMSIVYIFVPKKYLEEYTNASEKVENYLLSHSNIKNKIESEEIDQYIEIVFTSFPKSAFFVCDALLHQYHLISNFYPQSKNKFKYIIDFLHKNKDYKSKFIDIIHSILDEPNTHTQIKSLYESMLENDVDNLPDLLYNNNEYIQSFYLKLYASCLRLKKFEEAEKYSQKNLEYAPETEQLLFSQAMLSIHNKNYNRGYTLIEKILELPSNQREIDSNFIKKMYLKALLNDNKIEQAGLFMLDYQKECVQNSLNKAKKFKKTVRVKGISPEIIERIKAAQQELLELSQKKDSSYIASQSITKETQKAFSNLSLETSTQTSTEQESFVPYQQEKYVSTAPKEKIKTKGEGFESKPEKKAIIATKPTHHVKIEEILNHSNYEIFEKFFYKYFYNIKDTQVSISFKELQTLFKGLNQDLDRSKGKGSHSKITFDAALFGMNPEEVKKEMKIISNKTKLLPYQIKTIREMFLDYGLYPAYLKDKLIAKKLI